jgi:glycosyltransferase involved in cell wall biosynthesis
VLHVGKYYPPARGGMEQVLATLCQATQQRIDNRVLVFSDAKWTTHEVVDGIPVTRLATVALARSTPIATEMIGALRAADVDLIVLHEPNPWALVAMTLARPKPPLAVWYHSEVVRPALQYALFYHPWVRVVYRRASRIIVSSPLLGQHARALQPYRDRLAVIPFGIDASQWTPTSAIARRAAQIRAAHAGRPLVLFTGRMVEYKGAGVLLRALAGTDVDAVLAGDGPQRASLISLARTLGVESRVALPGEISQDELVALMHAADIFVLPSVNQAEAFGFVQLEAMACGVPVISTRVPSGVPWVNQDDVTGLVVTPGDVDGLRAAIRALASDPATRQRMGAAGKQRVADEFNLERMGDRAASLFESLASTHA